MVATMQSHGKGNPMNIHSIYTTRKREPGDGPGGPLTTVYLATVLGARSGVDAAEVYAEASGMTDVQHHGRTSHVAFTPTGIASFYSRKEVA